MRSAKTVSIRHLDSAVKAALAAAKKAHPDVVVEALSVGPADPLPIYYRYPFICGLPPFPWVVAQTEGLVEFNNTFVANLAQNRQIAEIAANGTFEAAVQASGNSIALGFTPADVSLTE